MPRLRWPPKVLPCASYRCSAPTSSTAYRSAVLGAHIPRIAIEAAHADFWRKYVGLHGAVIGIDRFGESAPAGQLFDLFGFTVANVVSTTKALLS